MQTLEANVRTDLLDSLKARIEKKVNKPARKLGLDEATLFLGDTFIRHYLTGVDSITGRWYNAIEDDKLADQRALVEGRDDREIVNFEFTEVVLIAAETKLEGWEFIGTIEHTEAGNILRTVPKHEETLPEKYRAVTNDCDHCGYDRRRKDTYIVLHEDGTYKQVGRTCIKDFLGHGNPDQIAAYFNEIIALWDSLSLGFNEDDPDFFGGRAPWELDTAGFLGTVAQAIRTNGWTSRGKAYEWQTYATADCAWDFDWDRRDGKSNAKLLDRFGFCEITDEAIADGKAALAWARGLTDADTAGNDYLHNLRVACSLDYTNGKRAGIVASAVSGWQRATEKAAKVERETTRKAEAKPLPIEDGRQTIAGEVISAKWRDDGYGASLKLTVQGEDGWRVWGTCPKVLLDDGDVVIGDVITFDAKLAGADNDNTFGFFKRPTKASFISRAQKEEVAA